jgi:hypothetical protein
MITEVKTGNTLFEKKLCIEQVSAVVWRPDGKQFAAVS